MNEAKVTKELMEKFPQKDIFSLPKLNPTEIICEIEPTTLHPEYSVAIAIIDRSVPHYHKLSTETYKVLKGELVLFVDGKKHHLRQDDTFVIHPRQVHYAEGNQTWVECRSEPGWTPEDHFLAV